MKKVIQDSVFLSIYLSGQIQMKDAEMKKEPRSAIQQHGDIGQGTYQSCTTNDIEKVLTKYLLSWKSLVHIFWKKTHDEMRNKKKNQ